MQIKVSHAKVTHFLGHSQYPSRVSSFFYIVFLSGEINDDTGFNALIGLHPFSTTEKESEMTKEFICVNALIGLHPFSTR